MVALSLLFLYRQFEIFLNSMVVGRPHLMVCSFGWEVSIFFLGNFCIRDVRVYISQTKYKNYSA